MRSRGPLSDAALRRRGPSTQTLGVANTTVMVSVVNQVQLRAVRDLPFCHVCGQALTGPGATDHDHVPPQTCFDKSDRNPPLKLRTHVRCNNESKLNDEKVGELIAAQRHRAINPAKTKLRIRTIRDAKTQRDFATFENLDVTGAIRRWIGGFHAALYARPLPPGSPFQITAPLPRGTLIGTTIQVDAILPQHAVFVQTIKLNRSARNFDTVRTCAGKLQYECVWAQEDRGTRWFCIFALNLYDWISIGDIKNFKPRGCVGAYALPAFDAPPNASRATHIHAPVANKSPFDPFGE